MDILQAVHSAGYKHGRAFFIKVEGGGEPFPIEKSVRRHYIRSAVKQGYKRRKVYLEAGLGLIEGMTAGAEFVAKKMMEGKA